MAIFSLNHSFIGRSKHAPGSASLSARYITRPEACTEIIGERMPTERGELFAWLDQQEAQDRKNARVIDKVIIALPIELSHEQNVELLRAYCERMTEGRASWVAAIHDGPGKDANNPHAHLIFRDRDVLTGRRVMMTTEAHSTERFRVGWEDEANLALERAGSIQRIDRRSLSDQGIDREPQIHVGPAAMHLAERDYQFKSNQVEVTRIIHGKVETVTINYPSVDQWKTRLEENEERIQRNRVRQELQNGEFPYEWAADPSMPVQQQSAILWNVVAQSRQKQIFESLSPSERMSAMAWVQAATNRADELYQRMVKGEPTGEANADELQLVERHIEERNSKALDTHLADLGRAMRDESERQGPGHRGMGLEM